ncbi:hypothetical protein EJK51_0025 [Moraxella catarrhalis]|nr:hypothetical protein EJK52_0026 [Moraxella catarrhalis]AZQ90503.1 hypothetical protein EJK51_0025 [Moraxella catarrhalis]
MLHDRTGRLESRLMILGCIFSLHDRTGRLEKKPCDDWR